MWIEKRMVHGKPRYCFIERYKSSLTGCYKRVSVTYGKKTRQVQKEATRELEDKIQEALAKEGHAVRDITMEQLEKNFLNTYIKQVRYNTYHNAKVILDRFINNIGKSSRPTSITTIWLNRYFSNQLYRDQCPLCNNTVRDKKGKINLLLTYAVDYGYLRNNPMDKVKISWKDESQRRRDEIENKYLTADEFHKIIEDCKDRRLPHYADALTLQCLTGLRFGELCALKPQNILHKNGKTYLQINSTLIWKRSPLQPVISHTTKTFAGKRTIILSPEAAQIVNKRAKGKSPNALLFTAKNKRPLNVNCVDATLKRIARKQKINKNLSTHIFRHTHVSVLADMGVPLRVIQKRVGHANGDITTKIYMHVTKQAQQEFENKIAEIDSF